LDIGFVRSVTHIGVLELHDDYQRGHLTDYAALYTSLSTRYNVELDNLSGQSLPFANVSTSSFRRGESSKKVELNRTTTTDLKNFLVRSNSTGLLHTEMMFDVGGSFRLTGDESLLQVENQTLISVDDCGVVRRNGDGDLEFAWIGALEAGDDVQLEFSALDGPVSSGWGKIEALVGNAKVAEQVWESQEFESGKPVELEVLAAVPELQSSWPQLSQILTDKMNALSRTNVNKSMLASALSEVNGSEASLASVFSCVAGNLQLGPGEIRLIGRTSQKLDQSRYSPAATQAKHNLLVLVHLKHADMPDCKRDSNAVSEFDSGRSNLNQEEDFDFIESSQ
jgi:hypothetical protein